MKGKLLQLRPDPTVDELTDEGLTAACATGDPSSLYIAQARHALANP